jgi:hypothetical protein
MPINSTQLLSVVSQITEDRHVRVTISESVKGGCIAATTTVVGGIVLGPVGLAIGVCCAWVVNCFHKSWEYFEQIISNALKFGMWCRCLL